MIGTLNHSMQFLVNVEYEATNQYLKPEDCLTMRARGAIMDGQPLSKNCIIIQLDG